MFLSCYQCGEEVLWLAPDARCNVCTRMTPDVVPGNYEPEEETDES